MADKILSLASIKKCLENIKSWASEKFTTLETMAGATQSQVNSQADELKKCVKRYPPQTVDFNKLTDAGFYRIQNDNTNAPTGINIDYGNATVVKGYDNADTVAQIVFPYAKDVNTFSARFGGLDDADVSFIEKQPWLYFHGSTSPNIPVLKKKTITGTTNYGGNVRFSESPIILSAYSDALFENVYSYICTPWINASGMGYIRIVNSKTNEVVSNTDFSLIVYYLEIPQDYEFPDTMQASDEPEDDTGLSPMESDAYEQR